jgi:succinate dehydrogenase / fumarate reductase cytochrome b subunit
MNWLTTFMNSSIGKKFTMGISGLLLCLFIAQHLVGNMMLFGGEALFNSYVATLSAFKPLLRIIEVLISIIFLSHIISGIRITLDNKRANSSSYNVNAGSETSSFSSRTMAITGSVVFIFVITHLSTIWYQFQLIHDSDSYYDIVLGDTVGFGHPIYAAFYVVAMILMGVHLKHGFQSAFQTFGVLDSRYKGLIEKVSMIFWLVIPAGFTWIALWFGFIAEAI